MEICHYTNLEGFQGIIQSQKMWATHHLYLNDKTELLHGLACAKKAAAMMDSVILAEGWKEQALAYIENNKSFNSVNIYTLCFCKEKSDLLSQWRAYSGNQQGICLVFDKDDLIEHFTKTNIDVFSMEGHQIEGNNFMFSYGDVNYSIPEETIKFKKFIEEQWQNTQELFKKHPELEMGSNLIPFMLDQLVTFFKHSGFEEENEFRFVVNKVIFTEMINFRNNGKYIIPYVEFGNKVKKLPLKRIVLGPCENHEILKRGIEMFLCKHGVDVPIINSNIPYRL